LRPTHATLPVLTWRKLPYNFRISSPQLQTRNEDKVVPSHWAVSVLVFDL